MRLALVTQLTQSRHTKRGRQVYAPVWWSLFESSLWKSRVDGGQGWTIRSATGLWRTTSWGMIGIYKSDIQEVGGYDPKIEGWGAEDIDLADRLLKAKTITFFRVVEPGLAHVWHDKNCTGAWNVKACNDVRLRNWRSTLTLASDLEIALRDLAALRQNSSKTTTTEYEKKIGQPTPKTTPSTAL